MDNQRYAPGGTSGIDGVAFEQVDANIMAKSAALQDDYVLQELLRLPPYTGTAVAKAILPYGVPPGALAASSSTTGFVAPNGATGGVRIMPFRAILGSRNVIVAPSGSPPTTPALDNWRDFRSVLYVPTDDNVTLGHAVGLAANSSGNPRWDLIVAAVQVDQPGAPYVRNVEDALGNVTTPSINTTYVNPIAINVVPGTPAATPSQPPVPTDGGGIYYLPLAYVWVPNGFSGASTVLPGSIQFVTPIAVHHARSTGNITSFPAQCISDVLPAADITAWSTTGVRPVHVIPVTQTGAHKTKFCFEVNGVTTSLADAAVIDVRVDWRYRQWTWKIFAHLTTSCSWAWEISPAFPAALIPRASLPQANMVGGCGQSHYANDAAEFGITTRGGSAVVLATAATFPGILSGAQTFGVYVDMTTGQLKLWNPLTTQSFVGRFLVDLEATGQYDCAH